MNKLLKKKFACGSLATLCLVAVMSFASAEAVEKNAVLSGLQINAVKDGSYEIIVKADRDIHVQKQVTSDDKVVLDLEGVQVSNSLNTVYNNTSDIDHVVFQPIGGKKVRVFLQGKNIASSKVTVDSDNYPLGLINKIKAEETPSEVLVLNKPMDSYKSVQNLETDEVNSEPSQSVEAGLLSNIQLNKANLGWVMSFVLLMIILMLGFKSLVSKTKKVKIDVLSDRLKNREIELYRDLSKKQGFIGAGIGLPKSTKLSGRQAPTSMQNYALKEYQNSQINPNTSNFNLMKNKSNPRISPTRCQTLQKPKVEPKTIRTSRTIKTQNPITKEEIGLAKGNIDSMRFLESMAKIYEKSGRVDLAHGLQNNIIKSKISNGR